MIKATSYEEAVSLGAETIIKDGDTEYRCYMPGEIQRPVVEAPPEPAVSDAQVVEFLRKAGLLEQIQAAIEESKT